MKTAVALLAVTATVAIASPYPDIRLPRDVLDLAEAELEMQALVEVGKESVMQMLELRGAEMLRRGQGAPRCTAKNIIFRREYGDLSKKERLAYINAVKCLQGLPPKTPATIAAGAKSRFDDFIVGHIQGALTIHWTGNFQPWHRWFLHNYEKALRDECGYTGYQPYWDWPKYASAPQDSPIFNGDQYSLGGNGEYVQHEGIVILPLPGVPGEPVRLPPGLGGGVVMAGPFANLSVNLGPVGGIDGMGMENQGPDGGLGYNPRPLRRDVGPVMNMQWANYSTIVRLLTRPDIDAYRRVSEGVPFTTELGPHAAMHWVFGLDPGSDVFISPGDPAFYVHHANVDRMWTIWQALDPATRQYDIGTGPYAHVTLANAPPSPLATLDDVLDLGFAAPSATIREVMDTTDGPLCYFYL